MCVVGSPEIRCVSQRSGVAYLDANVRGCASSSRNHHPYMASQTRPAAKEEGARELLLLLELLVNCFPACLSHRNRRTDPRSSGLAVCAGWRAGRQRYTRVCRRYSIQRNVLGDAASRSQKEADCGIKSRRPEKVRQVCHMREWRSASSFFEL